jgi:hypothetical protein
LIFPLRKHGFARATARPAESHSRVGLSPHKRGANAFLGFAVGQSGQARGAVTRQQRDHVRTAFDLAANPSPPVLVECDTTLIMDYLLSTPRGADADASKIPGGHSGCCAVMPDRMEIAGWYAAVGRLTDKSAAMLESTI